MVREVNARVFRIFSQLVWEKKIIRWSISCNSYVESGCDGGKSLLHISLFFVVLFVCFFFSLSFWTGLVSVFNRKHFFVPLELRCTLKGKVRRVGQAAHGVSINRGTLD